MESHREVWKIKFQQESATTGNFITDSMIPFQMIVVAQLWIHLPLPLLIDPTRIKYPTIPLICLHLPFMLPLKNILVNLTTPSYSPQLLLLTSDDPNPCHSTNKDKPYHGMVKILYCSRKHDEKHAKKQGLIDPSPPINTGNFITVMIFTGIIQRWWLSSRNMNIVWQIYHLIDVFALFIYFSLLNSFLCLFYSCYIFLPCSNT